MGNPLTLRKVIPAAVGAAVALHAQTVSAFFPALPTDPDVVSVSPPPPPVVLSTIPVPHIPVTVDPVVTTTVIVPPASAVATPLVISPLPPPPFAEPVAVQGTPTPTHHCGCHHPVSPQSVPEPATLVSAVLGLGAVGGFTWRRRKGQG